jgi:hypothetical protein
MKLKQKRNVVRDVMFLSAKTELDSITLSVAIFTLPLNEKLHSPWRE